MQHSTLSRPSSDVYKRQAHGDDFPAQFPVASQHVVTGVRFGESGFVAAGVDLYALALFDKQLQNRVHLVGVLRVRENALPIRYIADDIIDVSVHVEIIESPDILKSHVQIPVHTGGGVVRAPEIRIIGIKTVY